MARDRGRGRRRIEEDVEPLPVEPVVEPIGGGGRASGRERPARAPSGPSFALPIATAAALGAGAIGFLAALFVGQATAGDPALALDAGGIQAARMLAAIDLDRWDPKFGTTRAVREQVEKGFAERLASIAQEDSREAAQVESARDEWMSGTNAPGGNWRPGFDLFFPKGDVTDDLRAGAVQRALSRVTANVPDAFMGAAVMSEQKGILAQAGPGLLMPSPGANPRRQAGETKVYFVQAGGGRTAYIYEHPMVDMRGRTAGRALVVLDGSFAKPPNLVAAAGAAAGGAALGAFLLAFLLALGPVKSMRKLAGESEQLARGEFGTRVTVRGPDVVQATARNVQRLGHLAQSGAGAEPTVVTQEVAVVPVREIQEGLAPSRGFQRPEALEIESTSKPAADSGNDYHDVINVDAEHVGLFVADIPNQRGVRGAMYMAQVRALFRAAARGQTSPAEVLKAVNRGFAADLPRGVYATAMYVVLNHVTGICRVANAQHLPLVFYKQSKKASARLQPEGIALGLDPGPVFDKTMAEKAIQLERGDRVVLFTDGAIAARNAQGVQYGEERFYYVVNREAPKNSAACVNFIANDLDLFHEGAPQLDDFTVVTARKVR